MCLKTFKLITWYCEALFMGIISHAKLPLFGKHHPDYMESYLITNFYLIAKQVDPKAMFALQV